MAVSKGDVSRRERRIRGRDERESQVHEERERFAARARNKRIINYSLGAIAIVALAVVIYLFARGQGQGAHDALAQCLTDKGVVMYGTDWCPHCQAEKQRFGASFKHVTFVNCDLNKQACDAANVTGYPTWVFPEGGRAEGEQELDALALRSGCTDAA